MKRAAVYARFSSEGQREASIEDQTRSCVKLIEDRGWRIAGIYCDRAISGATTLRPDYQRLLRDARDHVFDVVVSEGLDRLSRDPEATAGLYKLDLLPRHRHCYSQRWGSNGPGCRPQGYDERAFSKGSRNQDAPRH